MISRPSFFTIWSLLGGLALAGLTAGLLWWGVTALRPPMAPAPVGTAQMYVIAAPTATILPPTPTATPEPTLPPGPQGALARGVDVRIFGTGGSGLRLRADPGLQGSIRLLAYEGEIYNVTDGPIESDGYVWWYLVAPYDDKAQGWAVSNYLEPAPAP